MAEASQDLGRVTDDEDATLAFRLGEAVRGKHAAHSAKGEDDAEQFGETSKARAEFHRLLSTAGRGKKSRN